MRAMSNQLLIFFYFSMIFFILSHYYSAVLYYSAVYIFDMKKGEKEVGKIMRPFKINKDIFLLFIFKWPAILCS